jgi:hypothetical protein
MSKKKNGDEETPIIRKDSTDQPDRDDKRKHSWRDGVSGGKDPNDDAQKGVTDWMKPPRPKGR